MRNKTIEEYWGTLSSEEPSSTHSTYPSEDCLTKLNRTSFALRCFGVLLNLAHVTSFILLSIHAVAILRLIHIWFHVAATFGYLICVVFWCKGSFDLRRLARITLSSGVAQVTAGLTFWYLREWLTGTEPERFDKSESCPLVNEIFGCVRYLWRFTPALYLVMGLVELLSFLFLLLLYPMLTRKGTSLWGLLVCVCLAAVASVVTTLCVGGSTALILTSLVMTTVAHLPIASPWWFDLICANSGAVIGAASICAICVVFETFCVLEKNLNPIFAILCTVILCATAVGSNVVAQTLKPPVSCVSTAVSFQV
eukprot:Protomagalhaensia_sp_Gyna_25__634@NODE_1299_length_1964_cov_53_907532_g61_i2_p1_GENE_NODE_1299_length_1964_cov_53_907532_g61_i2NODE_1299_length_1964_cov_53_907532_g61_i2_p1_ORF_typecomplete_len310_score12_53DC_STAMP/PF07782_13/0_27Gaa1/PF04114_14/7_8e02Gaa1/PF04114_14/0_082_NODE_1299_length_1964_cov_53_907532_g61_i26021531